MTDQELDKTKGLIEELEDLREYKRRMEANPYTEMYEGLRKQWDNLAKELKGDDDDGVTISIKGDDKAFDRFAKFIEKLGPMTDNIEKLRKKIGLENADEPRLARKENPVEATAKRQ